jgi:periplasmic protein TonB
MIQKIFISILLTYVSTNSIAQSSVPTNPTDTIKKVFSIVEQDAEFPGGIPAWIEYIQDNLKAKVPIKKGAPKGNYNVVVMFIVSKDGSVSNITPMTNYGYGMEEEVMRVIKKGPKWKPAILNGKTVNAYRRQPVTFQITD